MPVAEIEVDVDTVASLLVEQHPDLADLPLRFVAHGWDNAIFRLGEELAVRLPRRTAAVALIEHEQRWLPLLAESVSVPLPVPVRRGVPGALFPWPWSITPWFPGRPLAQLPPEDRRPYAHALGRFLAELHAPAPPGAPANPVRGIPLTGRSDALAQHLAIAPVQNPATLEALWQTLVATPPWSGAPVWLHGDPHPGNALVHDGALRAVIDFGDLTAGDPATDLAAAWLTFDAPGRVRFRQAYADGRLLDGDTWSRARGWALCLGVALVAHSDDVPVLAAVGRHALSEVLAAEPGQPT